MSTIGIVVVNYGSSRLLEKNLSTLDDLPDARIVVVDNRTDDTERARIERLARDHHWSLVTPGTNLGFGGGVNVGVERARAEGVDTLLLLNPDAVITGDDVRRLHTAARGATLTLFSPIVTTSTGDIWFDGAGLDVRNGQTVTSAHLGEDGIEPWLSGACLCFSTELWDATGGFDDDYFLYWEDVDFSRRVREAGGRLEVLRSASAVHDEGGTHTDVSSRPRRGRAKSQIYYYYNIRNRLVFARKHLAPSARRRWFVTSPAAAWEVLTRGGRRQFLDSLRPFHAAGSALVDGFLGRIGEKSDGGRPDGTAAVPTLTVLMTYIEPLPFHNPYVKMLDDALESTGHVNVEHFTWRRALVGRVDVLHAHWPEDVLSATSTAKSVGKQLCLALLLIRCRVCRIPIVRTVHNLELPTGHGPFATALLRAFDRCTTDRILISDTTPAVRGSSTVILHGDYVDWYARHPQPAAVSGRLGYFGMIRRYKNVEALVAAFTATRSDRPEWSLEVAGKPSSETLLTGLQTAAADDPRIILTLRYLEDAEVVATARRAELVVLPYKEMHNSGSLLAALSLGRPVLVPDNETNRALGAEVGTDWVLTYQGDLDAEDLERAMAVVHCAGRAPAPDLSRRRWDDAGRAHLAFYRAAIERARPGIPSAPSGR